MGQYRISRNIEASIIDFLTTELQSQWTNIAVEKTFARVYEINLPVICVRCGVTDHVRAEIGGDATIRTAQVLIDLFASSDGQRLDIKDYIIEKIKGGLIYYDYIITNGVIDTKTTNGRLRIMDIDDTPIDFDVDKNKLEVHDRYRHLITLFVSLGRVEE
jgi:hypothetical protein